MAAGEPYLGFAGCHAQCTSLHPAHRSSATIACRGANTPLAVTSLYAAASLYAK